MTIRLFVWRMRMMEVQQVPYSLHSSLLPGLSIGFLETLLGALFIWNFIICGILIGLMLLLDHKTNLTMHMHMLMEMVLTMMMMMTMVLEMEIMEWEIMEEIWTVMRKMIMMMMNLSMNLMKLCLMNLR